MSGKLIDSCAASYSFTRPWKRNPHRVLYPPRVSRGPAPITTATLCGCVLGQPRTGGARYCATCDAARPGGVTVPQVQATIHICWYNHPFLSRRMWCSTYSSASPESCFPVPSPWTIEPYFLIFSVSLRWVRLLSRRYCSSASCGNDSASSACESHGGVTPLC